MPEYRWSPGAGRYRDQRGRFVRETTVRSWVDTVSDTASDRMIGITRRLQSNQIDLAEWQRSMMQEIKDSHLATGLAAKGGRPQASPSDYGFLGSEIKKQYTYLNRWKEELRDGTAPLDGRVLTRAKLYGQAARGTHEDVRRREMRGREQNQERRVLHPADHCSTCLSEAGRGWQPLGTLRRIGDSECRSQCRCTFNYRRAERGQEAA